MSWNYILRKFNLNWLWRDIFYRLDWRKPNPLSIKDFLRKEVHYAKVLKSRGELPTFKNLTRDQIVLKCLEYVKANIEYESDMIRFNVIEKWQTVKETLSFLKGDCEDGAILLYALARANGISPAQITITCGDVIANGKIEGHCWIQYMPDSSFKGDKLGDWYTIDWCYWPDLRSFTKREPKDELRYIKSWWSITDFW